MNFYRVGDLGDGSYTLNAKGKLPVTFDQSQKLDYVHKGYSIFIQTDKAIYRPGKLCSISSFSVSVFPFVLELKRNTNLQSLNYEDIVH